MRVIRFCLLILLTCKVVIAGAQTDGTICNSKVLLPTAPDSTIKLGKDTTVAVYTRFNLKHVYFKAGGYFYNGANKILTCCYKDYSYSFDVFDNSYLVISFHKGPNYANGIGDFENDSVYIFNPKNGALKRVDFDGSTFDFTICLNSLKRYVMPAKAYLSGNKIPHLHAIITDIDFENDVITIFDAANRKQRLALSDITSPL